MKEGGGMIEGGGIIEGCRMIVVAVKQHPWKRRS